MKKFLAWFFSSLLALVLLLGLALIAVPWKSLAENQLKTMLAQKGYKDIQLNVTGIGPNRLMLENIATSGPHPLVLKKIDLDYSLNELVKGNLQTLHLGGLALEARQEKNTWVISGLPESSDKTPFRFPVTMEAVSALMPFGSITLQDSSLDILADAWRMDVPLDVKLTRAPAPSLIYKADHLALTTQQLQASSDAAGVNATLDTTAKTWRGTWQVNGIALKQSAAELPKLNATGTLAVLGDKISLQGKIASADNSYHSSFAYSYPLASPAAAQLVLTNTLMPWNKGSLALSRTEIPLSGKSDIHLKLEVNHVSLDSLLQALTGQKAQATGTVSGLLPVTLKADGGILIDTGNLKSEGPGTIKVAPEALPGDNEQIALVRDILKNFNYALVSVTASSGADHKLAVTMTLEGHNPDVYQGRQVKLNVHLSGDVLNFIQQSVMSLFDPKYFLKNGTTTQQKIGIEKK